MSVLSEEAQSKRSRFEKGVTLTLVAGSSRGVCERGAHEAGTARHSDRATQVQSAARAAVAMDPPTWLHRVPVSQPDGAAAAEREAAPGDSGIEGSRRCLGVTWAELRVALWLSVVCAITAALLAVPAGAA